MVDYNFSHLLLDPPRSGLTDDVISLVNRFENVIYISCNPETYVRDLSKLTDYKISKIEFFDQFVNTNHLEIVTFSKNQNNLITKPLHCFSIVQTLQRYEIH